ncbi:MAG: selenide, water dikinase SelD [Deltaproteobacteria bacterium]|nr:selenide, water dikinase SelD [Deltaproteobacteria bacterium]
MHLQKQKSTGWVTRWLYARISDVSLQKPHTPEASIRLLPDDSSSAEFRELVLVGGGHAHVQVLRRFMMRPLEGVRLTVVLDRYEAVYSGMVPGYLAGDYESHDLTIDMLPLARRAGARCILAAATGVDLEEKRISLEGRPPILFDIASFDVGSRVRELPGGASREHGIATRPIANFVRDIDDQILKAAAPPGSKIRVNVVGGGAAGVELALCVEARLREKGCPAEVQIVAGADTLLSGTHRSLVRRVTRELADRGIRTRLSARVISSDSHGINLASEKGPPEYLKSDLTLWATGAAAPAFLKESGLPTDEMGFVRVESTLQVEGFDCLFAAGDCARMVDHPWVPRAGVYAVRAGPYLDRNLRARLKGGRLQRWRPQRDFLALLNVGEKRAFGCKWGIGFEGRLVWRLKDWIDRRFMSRFQVLDQNGLPASLFPDPKEMEGLDEMICGGCAAKVGPSPLRTALDRLPPAPADSSVLVGLAEADDAAVLQWPAGDVVLATVDGFRAFVDDPFLVGRVAATNAVSDVLAKGAVARHALALVTVKADTPGREAESLFQVLAGIRAALDPIGVTLVGGHSTTGPELFVGLCVTGEPGSEGRILGLGGLSEGDALVLTKPIGTGVLLAADARGMARGDWLQVGLSNMVRDNSAAAAVALAPEVVACTDVSGFGLAAHLDELLSASNVGAELILENLPVLPGVADLIRWGIKSTFHEQNASQRTHLVRPNSDLDQALVELLYDPQTSGGLLMGVSPEHSVGLIQSLHSSGDLEACVIGRVVKASSPGPRISLASH